MNRSIQRHYVEEKLERFIKETEAIKTDIRRLIRDSASTEIYKADTPLFLLQGDDNNAKETGKWRGQHIRAQG